MEQRHMQEKSRGAARPDVDAVPGPFRSRSSISRVRRSPAMRARPPKARPDTLRAHSSVLLKRHAPGMTLAPSGGAQRPLRHTQRPAGGRHYAAKPRKRRRAPGGGMFFACVAVVILSLSWVITTLIELPAKRAAAGSLAALSASQAASSQADGSVAQTGEAVLGPVQQTDASYTQPSASLVALPEAGRVDMSYFDDALFVGDSLTPGLPGIFQRHPQREIRRLSGRGPQAVHGGPCGKHQRPAGGRHR